MKKTISLFLFLCFMHITCCQRSTAQVHDEQKANIVSEIERLFQKSLKAGEKLDIAGIKENVDDTLKAGFIDKGHYFQSFDVLMDGFEEAVTGVDSQNFNVTNKKITVLSGNAALLTAAGDYTVLTSNGQSFKGNFAWTFIYSKIGDNWKIIHTHMSALR